MKQGRLVVLEGLDGTGKTTQHARLLARLRAEGVPHESVSFPRYEKPSGRLISDYLQGAFGARPGDVNAFAASSFYAVDRFVSFRQEPWGDFYRAGGLVVLARYSTSNAIHQGAKLPEGEREAFFAWLAEYEYGRLGLPKPDLVLYLQVPPETARRQIETRAAKERTRADIHERDGAYLAACAESAASATRFFGWQTVPAAENGVMLPVETVHERIYEMMYKIL